MNLTHPQSKVERVSIIKFLKRVRRYLLRAREARQPVEHSIELANGAQRIALLVAIEHQLELNQVPYIKGGRADERRVRLHFRDDDARAACEAIVHAALHLDTEIKFKPAGSRRRSIEQLVRTLKSENFDRFDIWVNERRIERPQDRYEIYSLVEVDLWSRDTNAFKGANYYQAPRFNDVATAIQHSQFNVLVGAEGDGSRIRDLGEWEPEPDLFARQFPIDLVYTWVNDEDPEWLEAKNRYRPAKPTTRSQDERRGDHAERFRNRDELLYSLRSIEMFAPFVRKIYLVTMDQVPEWLDTSHPQIEMVDHRDIYSEPEALPTFNSSSIETQLHHIDGLAEHFIYFNDDVFLGRPCDWSEFFMSTGATKFFPAGHSIAASAVPDRAEEYLAADRNAIELMKKEFGFTVHRPMYHVPHSARRSVLYELEELFGDAFLACQRERFRSPNDLRPIAFMGHHYGYHTGRAVPGTINQRYLALWKPTIAAQLDGVLRSRKYHTFCINDVGVTPEREDEVNELVADFLDRYFSYPSRFERVDQKP